MPLAPEWQHPFVNVFKLCDIDTMREAETKGDVKEHMDKIIGKKVFKVRGIIPAANYLRVPRTKQASLGLTGRILYIQLKATPVKVFVIHIEAVTEDHNVHRLSISNMYTSDSVKRKSNGVQLPFPRPSHRWCVAAIDMLAALRSFTSSPFAYIKSIQMCSWLTVRTMFSSDYKFTLQQCSLPGGGAWLQAGAVRSLVHTHTPFHPAILPTARYLLAAIQSLPSDMALSHALDSSIFEMVWLPKEPLDAHTMDFMPPPKRIAAKRRTAGVASSAGGAVGAGGGKLSPTGKPGDDVDSDDQSSDQDNSTPPPRSPIDPPLLTPTTAAIIAAHRASAPVAAAIASRAVVQRTGEPGGQAQPFPRATTALLTGPASTAPVRPPIAFAAIGLGAAVQGPPLSPDPALELVRINALSGEFVRCLVWIPGGEEVAFAAASVVVLMHMGDAEPQGAAPPGLGGRQPQRISRQGRQRYLLGHTAFVCALAISSDGGLLVSAQEGKEALLRLWDVASCSCLAILQGHASGLSCVDISPDMRALAAVGLDGHARQTIALWNIAELRSQGKAELVVRHATEFNIKEDHLLTAGRDSIRMYRLKGGQLRGTSVRLVPMEKRVTSFGGGVSAALGPNIFTDIAFEAGVGVYSVDAFKVYVASASGALFQVDYTTRNLDCIYQLHSAAITCLLIADGLALTGGEDRLLRAWPLDFRDYLLEAEHEGSVTGLALSPDALRVVVGTENGVLGCLQIPNHSYSTLLRSHCGPVNAVAADPSRDQFCTVSSDGTLRIWDLLTHQQLYEFDAPGEAVTCIAYHPLASHYELAAGFANGRVRVFDVPSTTLLQHAVETLQCPLFNLLLRNGRVIANHHEITRLGPMEQQQHRAAVAELVFSPSGDRLFSGGMDGALVVYDVQRLYAPMQFLSAGVRDIKACCAVSADGAYFATVVRDPYRAVTSLLIFHGRSLDPFMRIETDASAFVKLAFSADSAELWALTKDRRLDRYELKDGQLVQQVVDVSSFDVTTLVVDPAGRYVLTAGVEGPLRLWGCIPLAALQRKGLPPHQSFLAHPSAVLGAAFHRGHLITVGEADCICIWRIRADARQTAIPARPALAASAAFHPRDLRSRAHPSTALGPVAAAEDHQLTTRAAALGTPLPRGAVLRAGPAPQLPGHPPPGEGGFADTVLTAVRGYTGSAMAASASPQQRRGTVTSPTVSPRLNAGRVPVGPAAFTGSPVRALAASPAPPHQQRPSSPLSLPPQQPSQQAPAPPAAPPAPPKCSWLLGYTPTGCNNVSWRPDTGLFAYVVEDMVVLEHLSTRSQRYLRGHTQPLACLAASPDGGQVAAAPLYPESSALAPDAAVGVAGVASTAPFADVVVWSVDSGEELWRLRYHPLGVQALSFSPDGRWLLSLGREPERSVVVWDVAAGLLVAAGRTQHAPVAAEWLWGGDMPAFASVGGDGLLLWTLQDSFLEQRGVPLSGPDDTVVPCTALAVDSDGAMLVAEASPRGAQVPIWHVEVSDVSGGAASVVQVSSLPRGVSVTAMAAGRHYALVATDQGDVVRYRRSTASGTWAEESSVRLDGRVACLSAEPDMRDAIASTSTSTIWFVGMQDASSVPIVCGQPAPVLGLFPAPHDPRIVASTSLDGLLRMWHLGPEDAEPAVELHSTAPCTTAAFLIRTQPGQLLPLPQPHLLGGYTDGSLRLFSLEPTVELQWALARHPAPLVGVAPHPRKPLVLTASRSVPEAVMVGFHGAMPNSFGACLFALCFLTLLLVPMLPCSDGSLAITDTDSTRLLSYITVFTAAGLSLSSPRGGKSPRSSAVQPTPGSGSLQAFAISPGSGASLAAVGWRSRFVVFGAPWDDPSCIPISSYDCRPADGRSDEEDTDALLSPDVPSLLAFVGGATKLLAFSSPLLLGAVLMYDYRLAAVVRRITVPQMVRSLSLTADGSALVLGGMERTAYVVHLASGNTEALTGHSGPVVAVAFTADGKNAVTVAGSLLLVWDAQTLLRGLTPPPPSPALRDF
ncbi:WD repeat domain-containing protein [Tetrabaena socialis]|uniref:WD repeat domain-containing protein n=1 Tax=Tetrabaena socialis TaxID=47790 RepID=A0A2J8A864_9CHLO|nr:WD repeat domain-containing protein [Tetrabaena socialis]|eukprot:PNH08695.1 WD repeat domain-containing protein [Tetrabaena socialis]